MGYYSFFVQVKVFSERTSLPENSSAPRVRHFQYLAKIWQDLRRNSRYDPRPPCQDNQDVKIKSKIVPSYSRIHDFPTILARYTRCQTLGFFSEDMCAIFTANDVLKSAEHPPFFIFIPNFLYVFYSILFQPELKRCPRKLSMS